MIEATFHVDPVAKGRPRFSTRGKFVQTYTPSKTKLFEKTLKTIAIKMGFMPMTEALEVIVHCYIQKPKSVKRKRPTVKPDIDNFQKGILDALNGVFWADDALICQVTATKSYVEGEGYITVRVTNLP